MEDLGSDDSLIASPSAADVPPAGWQSMFAIYLAGIACGVDVVANALKSPPAHKMMPSGKLRDTCGQWEKVRSYPVGRSYLLDMAPLHPRKPDQ